MGIIDEAKKAVAKAVTKISDEVNRGKYDISQLNTALLQDTDEVTHNENTKVEYTPPIIAPDAHNENEIDINDCNNVDAKETIKSLLVPSNTEKEESGAHKYTAPQPIQIQPLPVRVVETNENKEESNNNEYENCYNVTVIHDNTYPNKGSQSMMRLCDKKFIWDDSMSESEKPTYTRCPICGKTIVYTETHIA